MFLPLLSGDIDTMKPKLLIACVIVLFCLAFNYQFITADASPVLKTDDHNHIVAGYRAIHSFSDTLGWWTGKGTGWIHAHEGGFRPLSSYLHYAQVAMIFRYGHHPAAWLTFALLVANCLLTAAIAWHLTKSLPLSGLAGVLASAVWVWCPSVAPSHLLWHPISSDYMTLAFLQGALLSFLAWRETEKRSYLFAAWSLAILSMLSKEYGYIAPAMLLALSALPGAVARKRAAIHACAMGLVSIAFFAYRMTIIAKPRAPRTGRLEAAWNVLQSWFHPSPIDILLMDVWGFVACVLLYVGIGATVWLTWKNRAAVATYCQQETVKAQVLRIAVMFALVELSYAPFLGFKLEGHYTIPAVFFISLFVVVALDALRPLVSWPAMSFKSSRIAPSEKYLPSQH